MTRVCTRKRLAQAVKRSQVKVAERYRRQIHSYSMQQKGNRLDQQDYSHGLSISCRKPRSSHIWTIAASAKSCLILQLARTTLPRFLLAVGTAISIDFTI